MDLNSTLNINQSINQINNSVNVDTTNLLHYLTLPPQFLTDKTVNFLSNNNLPVTTRWTSLLFFFISFLMIKLGLKIANQVAKWILVILGVLLIIGILIPSW